MCLGVLPHLGCLTGGLSVTVVPPSSFPTVWTLEMLYVHHTLELFSVYDVIIRGHLVPLFSFCITLANRLRPLVQRGPPYSTKSSSSLRHLHELF